MSYRGANVLVTGGAGFIGSNLVDTLLEMGANVTVLDNFTTGKVENIENAKRHPNFSLIRGDIRDMETIDSATRGKHVVFHEAALVSVPKSVEDPVLNNSINIDGTLNVFLASIRNKVQRVVYASSAAVYGNNPTVPKKENMEREYESPYALSKGVDEDYANLFNRKRDPTSPTTFVGLRYFNVYGPRQDPKSPYSGVISIFLDRITNGTPITIFGKGDQTRDFVFVRDVVQANILAGLIPFNPASKSPYVFNVGTGKSKSLMELVRDIEYVTGKRANIAFNPPRAGDVKDSLASIRKIKTATGYTPRFTLAQGLQITFGR